MYKRLTVMLCVAALIFSILPYSAPPALAETALPFNFGFTDIEIAALEEAGGRIDIGESVEGGAVKGEFDHDGDGASFKLSHIPGTSYSSIPNGISLHFSSPLPAETLYRISVWFYVPEEGNTEEKSPLLGPGILINGEAGDNSYKWPNSPETAGRVSYDEWINVVFETGELAVIEFLIFRFYTNDAPTHPEVWYIDDISITLLESDEDTEIEDLPALKDIYEDYFLFGAAGIVTDLTGKRLELIKKHFNSFTYGNEMKPSSTQNEEGVFTLDTLDRMTNIVKANGFQIVGHVLLWHQQSPSWFWSEKDKAIERMEAHIETVLRHAGPDLIAVDVVNEAFTNNGGNGGWTAQLRTEGWYSALGYEFIEIAFRKADEVRQAIGRPDLKLYYNEFNEEFPAKAQNIYDMVVSFQKNGVPIDGIGMQGHYNASTKIDDVRSAIKLFNTLPDIEVSITELDITIESSRGNPALSKEEELYQANMYAELFKIFKEYAAGPANPDEKKRLITRVTIWGLTDNQSWRSDRHPLLFDKNNKAKAAFYAVMDPDNYLSLLNVDNQDEPAPNPSEPPEEQSSASGPVPSPAGGETPPPAETDEASDFPWWIVIVLAVAAVAGVCAWVVLKMRKKR
ncbi:MAG: endo-1,4-beta-xylanase [Oscillospiraceae bacterium]|jgi:endo-1,4-beta-xylanase|nr:endo-1,4-beta-xylanase [Oscillospiraceae bacterium]